MTPKAICSAFQQSGMWLIDASVFSEADYAPSLHSSTQMAGPPSYPAYVASSPVSGKTTNFTDTDWVLTETNTSSSEAGDNLSTTMVSSIVKPYCHLLNARLGGTGRLGDLHD
jgi:hypothetical protein